jgi:hypothetical protein
MVFTMRRRRTSPAAHHSARLPPVVRSPLTRPAVHADAQERRRSQARAPGTSRIVCGQWSGGGRLHSLLGRLRRTHPLLRPENIEPNPYPAYSIMIHVQCVSFKAGRARCLCVGCLVGHRGKITTTRQYANACVQPTVDLNR